MFRAAVLTCAVTSATLFASCFCGTLVASAADWSDKAFPIKTHDFGAVAVASKTEFRFPIYNTFNSEMHIQTVRASCGCTTPVVESEYIPPGGTGSILARFNTSTFRGKKGATLTVVIDKPIYSEVRLRVDGYIRQDMVFHPGSIEFGKTNQGEAVSKSSKVMYAGRSDWEIVDVKANQPWIQPQLKLLSRGGGSAQYELTVTLREDAPTGFFQDEVLVMTNDRAMPKVPFVVSGQVDSALSIAPQSIAMGSLKPGESVEKRLVIRGQSPFAIESITCEGWNVEFEPATAPKSTHLINVRFTPTEAAGAQRVAVVIKTAGAESVTAKALLTADIRDK